MVANFRSPRRINWLRVRRRAQVAAAKTWMLVDGVSDVALVLAFTLIGLKAYALGMAEALPKVFGL